MATTKFRPMLAAHLEWERVLYPVFVSPKLDGLRALVYKGQLVSRTLKPIPNDHIRKLLSKPQLEGLDGELIVGDPFAPGVYGRTESAVMTKEGAPSFVYWAFDLWNRPGNFTERNRELTKLVERYPWWLSQVSQRTAYVREDVEATEKEFVEEGAEGVIVRDPEAAYKFGRSTAAEGALLKLVRHRDEEAKIVRCVELQRNGNKATKDERGYTKRSTHKANKRPAGCLGALVVESENYPDVFSIGTGFTQEQRETFWRHRRRLIGKVIKFRFKPHGMKDAPRHPVFLGFRKAIDL